MASSILKTSSTIICTTLAISTSILIFIIVFSFSNHPKCLQTDIIHMTTHQSSLPSYHTTNISNLVFAILGSTNAWHYRKSYIESWWRPNITRGYLYLDTAPTDDLLPWSHSSPPFRISDDNTKLLEETKHVSPFMVRMVHALIEVFREEREGVRWYIMGDDDSIFFVDNLVDELSKYDHTKYIYIGDNSESISSNQIFSYDMGFGGAGVILSYPLAEMVQKNLEDCLGRYPYLRFADQTLMTCINDFGVSLTIHRGLHQMDLHGDVSGFLSSHPQTPLLSLHHLDHLDPIFQSMDRFESAKHLMKAADIDQSRLVQQTICYDRRLTWSFSCSWGYSVQIYEKVIPRSILKFPFETFKPWFLDSQPPLFIFNTRPVVTNDPCATPHVFTFESIKTINESEVQTNYVRMASRGLPTCELAGNHSADLISRIEVVSPIKKPKQNGKTECCDVVESNVMEVTKIKLRDCLDNELIA
ncbi:uncharacterized protein LOC111880461 [Lactuca sativa]|uniref:uncharacterized protein LOC111880461 n=1 Tax=Lactuca sativa TaxID=4236 RepID=UPI0022AEB0E8|nr:uncharacterized protein LOC111880461 [Lactuca sativa]